MGTDHLLSSNCLSRFLLIVLLTATLSACGPSHRAASDALESGDEKKALDLYKRLAAENDPAGEWHYGVMLFHGRGVEAAPREAAPHLKAGKSYFEKNKGSLYSPQQIEDYEVILDAFGADGDYGFKGLDLAWQSSYRLAGGYSEAYSTSHDDVCREYYEMPCSTAVAAGVKWDPQERYIYDRYAPILTHDSPGLVRGMAEAEAKATDRENVRSRLNQALEASLREGQIDAAELCLKNGASPSFTKYGSSRRLITRVSGWPLDEDTMQQAYRLLLDNGAAFEKDTINYDSALELASRRYSPETLQILLEHYPNDDPDMESYYSEALFSAARYGNDSVIDFLLDQGADPSNRGHAFDMGLTPWDAAMKAGHRKIASKLSEVTPESDRVLNPTPHTSEVVAPARTKANVRLKNRPSDDGNFVASLTPNAPLHVVDVQGAWCEVSGHGVHADGERFFYDGQLDRAWMRCSNLEKVDAF